MQHLTKLVPVYMWTQTLNDCIIDQTRQTDIQPYTEISNICICVIWGYSREQALDRHLYKNTTGKLWLRSPVNQLKLNNVLVHGVDYVSLCRGVMTVEALKLVCGREPEMQDVTVELFLASPVYMKLFVTSGNSFVPFHRDLIANFSARPSSPSNHRRDSLVDPKELQQLVAPKTSHLCPPREQLFSERPKRETPN